MKNICVYSKSKIKTKVIIKQNLEHFLLQLFFVEVLVHFVSTSFSIQSHLVQKHLNRKLMLL